MDYGTILLYLATIFLSALFAGRATYYRKLYCLDAEAQQNARQIRALKKAELRWLVIATLPLIVLSALRYRTGADYVQYTWNYARLFEAHSFKYIFTVDEPGYLFTMWLTSLLFGADPQPWFALMAILTIGNCFYALYRLNENTDYSLFVILFGLYFYLHSFNYVRQLFAASLLLLGFSYVREKRWWRVTLCIVGALLFHRSSLIVSLLYFLGLLLKRYKSFYTVLTIVGLSILGILAPRILVHIPFFARYVGYVNRSFSLGVGWIIDILPLMLCCVLSMTKTTSDLITECQRMVVFSIPIRLMSYYTYAIGRLFITLSLFGFLAAALSINYRRDKTIAKIVYYLVFIVFFVYYFGYANNSEVIPYQWIFSK